MIHLVEKDFALKNHFNQIQIVSNGVINVNLMDNNALICQFNALHFLEIQMFVHNF